MNKNIQRKLGPILTISALLLGLFVITYFSLEKILKPPDDKSFKFFFAIDRSNSYGISKKNERKRSAEEIFDSAKSALLYMLGDDIFQKGDTVIGIYSFTDEKTDDIPRYFDQDLAVGLNGRDIVRTFLRDNITRIELRKGREYETYYRNVLDLAYQKFREHKAEPEQSIFIMLTDERGSEVDSVKERPPEEYGEFNVIMLVARAHEPGALDIIPNEFLLKTTDKREYTIIKSYVEEARNYYIKKYSKEEQTFDIKKLGIGVIILVFLFFLIWRSFGWPNNNLLFQPIKTQIHGLTQVIYSPVSNTIMVSATFPLPEPRVYEQEVQNYRIETSSEESTYYTIDSGDLKKDSYEAILHVEEELVPRLYFLVVHDMQGNVYKKPFEAKSIERPPEYLLQIRDTKDYYNPRTIRLGAQFLQVTQVTEGEHLQTRIEARIHQNQKWLQLRVSAGLALLLDPNSGYSPVEFEEKEMDIFTHINKKILVELPEEGSTLEFMLTRAS